MALMGLISKLFGNKYDRDMKEVKPLVEQIKAVYPQIQALSHDELRQRSADLREKIRGSVKDDEQKIIDLKAQIEAGGISVSQREKIYKDIDNTEKGIVEKIEAALTEALPRNNFV